ncbi:MAG: T9SS type A sorting domain-containing protein [Candidatus Marinimicrobia bacterium]|nr:T9SS type A sorting domain-containing protein [Candidatus Neomarinimicrobiota bacterium]MCF7880606.1 T9SS type A sorting domain-containing protein [Candidatus Neomarinimicrobiota bacterium]
MKRISVLFTLIFSVMFLSAGSLQAQGENFEEYTVGDSLHTIGWYETDLEAVVVDDTVASGSNALKCIVHNYNAAPVMEVVLPSGATLADYTQIKFKGFFAQGDVGWKDIYVEAYDTEPSAVFNNSEADVALGSYYRAKGASTDWETIRIDIANSSSLTDTVYIALGMHASGADGDGNTTIYYLDDIELRNTEVNTWGFLGGRSGGNADWGISGVGAGEVTMGDGGPPDGQWAAIRGAFSDTLTATTSEAIVVTGKLELVGGGLTSWSPLRYGLFHHDSAGVLQYTGTDSVAWTGREDTTFGYMFSPRVGANDQTSGQGGNGSVWAVNGGSWISTWSGGTMTMGVYDQAPRRAEMTAGVYDFAFSIQPQGDGTNEVRWFLTKPDNSYWFAGSAIDTMQVTTKLNGICVGINGGNGISESTLNSVSLSDVKAELGSPIAIPTKPFSSFYVSDWGATNRGDGWPILNDSTTRVGDGGMGSDGPPPSWATIRGGFGTEVQATTQEAIIVSGQFEYVDGGPGTSYVPLRYALTLQTDSLSNPDGGTLNYQYTDSAKWELEGNLHYGYELTPRSGTTDMANGAGGAGTIWTINGGGGWNSTWSNNGGPIAAIEQAPRRAVIAEGVYDFAFSVQPQGDGTNEVRWYMFHTDKESYWFGGTVIDTAQVTTQFNGIAFGVGDGIETNMSAFNVMAVQVDRGAPIIVPEAPFQSFYVSDWGATNRGDGWPILNDSTTRVGDAGMGSDGPPPTWATIRGGFGTEVEATTEEAIIVNGQFEYVDGGPGASYVPLRYALTLQTDSLSNPDGGTLNYQYTDSAMWELEGNLHYGYELTPRSGTTDMANGGGGAGTIWTINGGGGWNSTWSNNGGPIAAINQAPRRAEIAEGVYDFAFSVQPQGDGTNEVRWFMYHVDSLYWFGGTVIDTAQVSTKFNGVAFGVGDGIETNMSAFNLMAVQVDRGDPITVPEPPFEAFYVEDWGFIGDRFGGGTWTLTPGELDGNTTISGDAATNWSAVRGGFGGPVKPSTEEAIIVKGSVTFVDGGFEDWSSFRFGLFQSDSAGTLDSTEAHGYVWNGTEDYSSGYLLLPLSGDADLVSWQGIGETGTFGAVVDRPWLSTNGSNDYVLGSKMQWPADAVAGAGTYNFEISVQPQSDGTSELRFKLIKDDDNYKFWSTAIDDHDPLATDMFNSIAFATNNSTTTALEIRDVFVDLGDPIEVPTGIDPGDNAIPDEFALNQNYPNPFNPVTTIDFALPKQADVSLVVYDIRGQMVEKLVNTNMDAGYHSINFNASHLASGIYFYKITAGDFESVKKLTLLK